MQFYFFFKRKWNSSKKSGTVFVLVGEPFLLKLSLNTWPRPCSELTGVRVNVTFYVQNAKKSPLSTLTEIVAAGAPRSAQKISFGEFLIPSEKLRSLRFFLDFIFDGLFL